MTFDARRTCSVGALDDLHHAAAELLQHALLLYGVDLSRALRLFSLRHQTATRRLRYRLRHEAVRQPLAAAGRMRRS